MTTQEDVGTTTREFIYKNTIVWSIPNFFNLPKNWDHRVHSPKFTFMGAKWYLRMYPNCQRYYNRGKCIELYLIRDRIATEKCCVTYKLGIRRRDGTDYTIVVDEKDFSRNSNSGSYLVLERAAFFNGMRELAPQGTVTFFCTCYGNIGESKEAASQTTLTEGIYKLSEDLEELLSTDSLCDITLKFGDRELRAHRAVLGARSSVFKAMFTHNTTESNTGIIEIEDCDPGVFQDFLSFLYTGKTENLSSGNVPHLYTVADKYDVQEVKAVCLKLMGKNLCMDNFCDIVAIALRHSESQLLKYAIEYFARNTKEIISTAKWQSFLKQYPIECNELHIKAIDYNNQVK